MHPRWCIVYVFLRVRGTPDLTAISSAVPITNPIYIYACSLIPCLFLSNITWEQRVRTCVLLSVINVHFCNSCACGCCVYCNEKQQVFPWFCNWNSIFILSLCWMMGAWTGLKNFDSERFEEMIWCKRKNIYVVKMIHKTLFLRKINYIRLSDVNVRSSD